MLDPTPDDPALVSATIRLREFRDREFRTTPRPKCEPLLDLIEMCWRMRGPSGRVLECGVYQTDTGIEVRCGYGVNGLLQSEHVATADVGRLLADQWKAAVLDKGSFVDVNLQTSAFIPRWRRRYLPDFSWKL